MANDRQEDPDERWPIAEIRLKTILKVHDLEVDRHGGDNPYIQISAGGFILIDSMGSVLYADVQFSAEASDEETVERYRQQLRPQSLHWIESTSFDFVDRTVRLMGPVLEPVLEADAAAIDAFFPVQVAEGWPPGEEQFYYAGIIFEEGRGRFMGYRRWER